MNNAELARVLEQIRLVLDLKGDENFYRIRAYERAAQTITQSRYEMRDIYKAGGTKALLELPGIGQDIALKLEELIKTGKLKYLEALRKKIPAGLFDILDVEGMGPKRTKFVWEKYNVRDLKGLEKLMKSGELLSVKGWGEKSIAKVIKNIGLHKHSAGRLPYAVALKAAQRIVKALEKTKLCTKIEIAGSLRRKSETVGDIDILVTSKSPAKLIDFFTHLPGVLTIHGQGPTKASVALDIGMDADLRVLPANVFGAALQYFTGNKDHNVKLRKLAIRKGYTISEYGVFRGRASKKGELVASRTEKDVYNIVGLPWIPPEERLDRGEIEAAMNGEKALNDYLKQS